MFPESKAISLQDHIQNMTWLSESERKEAGRLSDLIELERERLTEKHPKRTELEFFGLLSTETTRVSIYKRKSWDFFINNLESSNAILSGFYPESEYPLLHQSEFLEFVHKLDTGNDAIFWRWQCSLIANEAVMNKIAVKQQEARQLEARRKGGKNSMKTHHKNEAYRCWEDWQANKGTHKNQEAFILSMQNKLGVSRQSVMTWLKEWKTLQKSTNA